MVFDRQAWKKADLVHRIWSPSNSFANNVTEKRKRREPVRACSLLTRPLLQRICDSSTLAAVKPPVHTSINLSMIFQPDSQLLSWHCTVNGNVWWYQANLVVSNSLHNDGKNIFDVSKLFAFPVACGILAYRNIHRNHCIVCLKTNDVWESRVQGLVWGDGPWEY